MGLDKVKVEKFITAAMKYLHNKYSMAKRMVDIAGKDGYSDCSSIFEKALNALGWNTRPGVAVTTHRMGIEGDSRFREIPLNSIQRGDAVWWHKIKNGKYEGHVGLYLGNNKVLEAIKTGVSIQPLNRIPWEKAYRVVALETKISNVKPVVTKKDLQGVTITNLNARDHDSVKGKVLGTIKKGDKIIITGQTNSKWYEIEYKGGKAYVSNAYVKVENKKTADIKPGNPEDAIIENIPILINGKHVKNGYIIKGVTYANVNGSDVPIRRLFENMGAKVEWIDNKVQITL